MKKYTKYLIVLTFLALAGFRAVAQEKNSTVNYSKISFEKTVHDFGYIKEENGKVSYEFKFTNKTNSPITINDVKASCGCTTPSWTRSPVAPGMSGYVKAQYDPTNRPNAFTKNLSVSYSYDNTTAVEVLIIKGTVVPKAKTISDAFPTKIGNLRFTSDYMNFYAINTKEPITKEFKFYNEGNKKISLKNPSTIAEHLKLSFNKNFISPKDTGILKVTYDAKKKADYGYVYDIVEFMTDDTLEQKKKLYVVADISEYFSPISKEDSLLVPKLNFDRSTHNFGAIKQGDIVTTTFEVSNKGKSDLKIYKTKASCGCTVSSLEKNLLKPGEKTTLKVSYNSTGKSGFDTKSVTLYCNDPTYSEAMVVIKAEVQPAENKDTTKQK